MKLIAAILLGLMELSVSAATYYVATNGSNSADGSLATPWSNIWYAAKTVVAGDSVIIKAGEYNEFVTNSVSGSAGLPITFSGERGALGEWLTIIDPSTSVTNGWIAAPEIGSGVYKITNAPFMVHDLTIDHKRVAFVYTMGGLDSITSAYHLFTTPTNGWEFLALATNVTVAMSQSPYSNIYWWDGVEALWGTTNSTNLFLRMRDGSDPNGLSISIVRNGTASLDSTDVHAPAINLTDASYITWSNVCVRGAICGFYLQGAACHHNTIVSNSVYGGTRRINIGLGANNNTVFRNEITANYYGYYDPGAWGGGQTYGYKYSVREQLYLIAKYFMGKNTSLDYGISCSACAESNTVSENHVFKGLGTGIDVSGILGSYPTITNTTVCGNLVEGMPSIGILLGEAETQTTVCSNYLSDSDLNVRFHHFAEDLETDRVMYFYRNKCWLPSYIGDHMFFHFSENTVKPYMARALLYHNSFSGGRGGLTISSFAVSAQGLTNCMFLNNIFSDTQYYYTDNSSLTNASYMGVFDYNLVTPPFPSYPNTNNPQWFGTNNIRQGTVEWTSVSNMTFTLSSGSRAINAAIDVTQPFTISGTNYAAFPYGSDVKVGPAWDMGALEAGYIGNIGTLRVGTLRGP